MKPFVKLCSVAASFPQPNIDTDIIFPARFLLLIEKSGVGRYAFYARRYDEEGLPIPDFVLNKPPFSSAQIAICGENFGCGSSREQAVWTLADFGIRCVIAPSFGEIFYSNCFKNGILPIVLDEADVAGLRGLAEQGERLTIDLQDQTISTDTKVIQTFKVDPHRREILIKGWDEIDLILNHDSSAISRFEENQRKHSPWLYHD